MGNKLKIEQDVADAIELFLNDLVESGWGIEGSKAGLVAEHYNTNFSEYEDGQYKSLDKITTFNLMQCMVNGYEIV